MQGFPLEFGIGARGYKSLYDGATRRSKSFKIGVVVLIQYRLWQTDRQTDRHTATQPRCRSKDAAYYVARVITDFLLYRRDHIKRKGEGACIYVSTLLQSCLYYSSNDFEVIWAKVPVCGCGERYFVASCYHPPKPNYSVDDFVAQLLSTVEDIIDREVNPVSLIHVYFVISFVFALSSFRV